MLKPYEHQKKAIELGVDSLKTEGFFGLLMEMGTGKTLSTLWIAQRLKLTHIVIICPKVLIDTWQKEIDQLYGETTITHIVENKNTTKYRRAYLDFLKSGKIKFLFYNTEGFQNTNKIKNGTLNMFYSHGNDVLTALDESSYIKNFKANRTKNIIALTKDSKYKLILTGTEITKSVMDLYTQFDFLQKGFWYKQSKLRSFWTFRARYSVMEDVYLNQGRSFKKIVGFKKIDELKNTIAPYIFRAKKKDCLDLPEKIYQDIILEMPKDLKNIYGQLKKNLWVEFGNSELTVQNKAVLFMRFRQLVGGFMPESGELISSYKIEALIDDWADCSQKTIIWSAFTAEIEQLTKALNEKKLKTVSYYGKQSDSEKKRALEDFENDPDCYFFVANPASGGHGLNLQFSSLTYWYSRTLSPAQNWQASDRQHRIGQKNNVTYKNLITKDTVDQRVKKLLDSSTDLANMFASTSTEDFFKLI